MMAGGLCYTDKGDISVIGGLAKEFFIRVGKKYGYNSTFWNFEPHIATEIFFDFITEHKIDVFLNHYLTENENAVIKIGTKISSFQTDGPNGTDFFKASMFIDASYEGHLMAAAGVSYTWGRESVKDFNESYAGYRGPGGDDSNGMDFTVKVNPYFDNGTLISHVQPAPTTAIGDADKLVQAYNFRFVERRGERKKCSDGNFDKKK